MQDEQWELLLQLTHQSLSHAQELASSTERLCQQVLGALLENLPQHTHSQLTAHRLEHSPDPTCPFPWGRIVPSTLPAHRAGKREDRIPPEQPQTWCWPALGADQLSQTLASSLESGSGLCSKARTSRL